MANHSPQCMAMSDIASSVTLGVLVLFLQCDAVWKRKAVYDFSAADRARPCQPLNGCFRLKPCVMQRFLDKFNRVIWHALKARTALKLRDITRSTQSASQMIPKVNVRGTLCVYRL